ncbi:MAG: tryptophan--tRNA ligase [Planctomycetota bacterium]
MRVLSGLTPSADGVHMGNYFGAIRQWIALQDEPGADAYYFIASYHGLISVRDRKLTEANGRGVALDYLALGLDPNKAVLYRQSDLPEVCELTWILTTLTPMGLLERCHAYKDKVARGIPADHGLFAYPVLMAADILMPKGERVPVGQDQKQHVEVARDIAQKFNHTYGEVFPLPEPLIPDGAAKVPGIDGEKMSKSYGNAILVFDTEKRVKKTIGKIVTDSAGVDEKKEPEGNVIFELYKLVAGDDAVKAMAEQFRAGGYGYGHAKVALFEAFMDYFGAFRTRRAELERNPAEVEEILVHGAAKAREVAAETLDQVRTATGLAAKID